MITQTGGMCRATNYAGMLRKGLPDSGYPQVPVLAVSAQGLEDNPGFPLTPTLVHRGIQAVIVGDLLQKVLLRTRPYEKVPGSADALYRRWDRIARSPSARVAGRRRCVVGSATRSSFERITEEFDALELDDIPRKPRVGLVGEILLKFHPDANNDAVGVIEAEGCERSRRGAGVLPDEPAVGWVAPRQPGAGQQGGRAHA